MFSEMGWRQYVQWKIFCAEIECETKMKDIRAVLIFDQFCQNFVLKYKEWYSPPTVDSISCQVEVIEVDLKLVLGGIVFCAAIEDQTYIINVNG